MPRERKDVRRAYFKKGKPEWLQFGRIEIEDTPPAKIKKYYIPPYRTLLRNRSMPPKGMGLVYDPSSMISLNYIAGVLLLPIATR